MINEFWCVYASFGRLGFEKVFAKLSGLISISVIRVGSLCNEVFAFTLRFSSIVFASPSISGCISDHW